MGASKEIKKNEEKQIIIKLYKRKKQKQIRDRETDEKKKKKGSIRMSFVW